MNRFKLSRAAAAVALSLALGHVAPTQAQIPVTDVASLTQQIQQVLAWAQQYTQMIEQIRNQVQQIQQLQNTYDSMTGNRGLEMLLNGAGDQAARRYLPEDMRRIYDLYSGTIVPGYAALNARIQGLRGTISSLPPGYFPAGSALETQLNQALDLISTQRVMAEESYNAMSTRTRNTENLMATIGMATDPKAIAELQARIQGEQVLATNEANRIALMRYQQEVQRQQQERRSLENLARTAKPLGATTLPMTVR